MKVTIFEKEKRTEEKESDDREEETKEEKKREELTHEKVPMLEGEHEIEKIIFEHEIEKIIFNLHHASCQELTEEEDNELQKYAKGMGYQAGATVFGGSKRYILGCIPDTNEIKAVRTIMEDDRFSKLEQGLTTLS